jgi:amidophosphoribosyltransferase
LPHASRIEPHAPYAGPREHCGVVGLWDVPEPAHHAYHALYALQHRGQESAGIAVCSEAGRIERHAAMGLVPNVFSARDLESLDAVYAGCPGAAIGHNRYSTTGASEHENTQPFVGYTAGGMVALAHNGNIVNAKQLRDRLEGEGRAFTSTTDTEVVLQLLARAVDEDDPLAWALAQLEGAFSLVVLHPDRVELARDPHGWRPLVIGALDHPDAPGPAGFVGASETVALDAIGARFVREVEPGEIVTLSDRGVTSRRFNEADRTAHCVFEHVYFASPASRVFGSTVQLVRERLGERLAQESPVEADLVTPMPDSGRSAATGFARASGLPYREAIIPNRYVGRTFIKPTMGERAAAVRLKLNVVGEIVKGQRIVVVDDSIVRGTTTRLKMDQLRGAGAKEIHLRISCPPIRHACYFGVDFPDRSELIATDRTPQDIARLLGVDSVAYLSIDGLHDVVGTEEVPGDRYCDACFSGRYPITIEGELRKDALTKHC